jgi:hypothetical protein
VPALERPWNHLPKRSAGADFTRADYAVARARAREVARATLGEALWAQLQRQGYLDARVAFILKNDSEAQPAWPSTSGLQF